MSSKWLTRIALVLLIIIIIVIYQSLGLGQYLSLENLKLHQQSLNQYYEQNPFLVIGAYAFIYILSTALSLPGATILTLAGGAVFGFTAGMIIVSFASTIGATFAFLASRFLLRDVVQKKFKDKLESINRGVEKEGAFYLFTLRLVPIFPFFLINLVMGLTPIRTVIFFFISQVGMLPGTAAYVNAGTQLAKIESVKQVLSMPLILSFVLIGILPIISKWLISSVKSRRYLKKYKKPKSFDYNIVVIGAGAAGLVSAYIASAVKAKVALIEKHKMGGDCLNTGCVPSKALIRSAKVSALLQRSEEFGFQSVPMRVQFSKVMQRVQKIIEHIEPHDSVERYTQLGVECISGAAKVRSPYEVEVNGKTLTTRNIIIATGASPLVPPLPGLKDVKYLTSDNLWELRELPQKLVILGGGPIGCELAQSFARLSSQVTIVEMNERIMSKEDPEVSFYIQEILKKENVEVLTGHQAIRFQSNELVCTHLGEEKKISFDQVILALGRKANIKGFGLEELQVEISPQGTLAVDEYLRTTHYPNIYACGDVAGPFQFTHAASHQAWYASVNSLFSPLKKFKADYRVIPWCTFTDPEVARVGLCETDAKQLSIPYEVTRYGIDDLDRAIADSEAHGFVKVLTKPGSDHILGVTIVGQHAGEIIAEYVLAMKYGIGLNRILGTIHIYPTMSEANKYAAGVWKKAHAPQNILSYLAKFHSWRRR